MGVRYQSLINVDATVTVANTDIITDITIEHDGILRLGLESIDAADWRITLNTTNFTTVLDSAADIWEFVEVPVSKGDVFNIQTVAIETVSIRGVLISTTERD